MTNQKVSNCVESDLVLLLIWNFCLSNRIWRQIKIKLNNIEPGIQGIYNP